MARKKRERNPNEKVVAIYFNTDNPNDYAIVEALSAMNKSEKQEFMRRALYDSLWPPDKNPVEQEQREALQEPIGLQLIIDAIVEGNVELIRTIKSSTYEVISKIEDMPKAQQDNQEETAIMPGGVEAIMEEIDPNVDTPFLAGVRKMGARPGMHMND